MTIRHEIDDDARAEVGFEFVRLVAAYFDEAGRGDGPVSASRPAEEIAARFAEALPRSGAPVADVIARLVRDVLPDANRLVHPMAMGHQVAPPLPVAVWTDALIAALNQSVAVREMSPVGTILEHRVVRWLADLAGLGPRAGGTFTSGGTEATFAALLAARAHVLPNAWTDGVGGEPPVVLCGEHAHYAVARAVGQMGLGTRSLHLVPSRDWRMDVDALGTALDALAREGRRVLAVVATAGSTATGSFDDLDAIADRCDAHDVWLHVDGAHGASSLFSAAHRHRTAGIARARSIAWDPHKMMLLPLAAGVVLVRDASDLERAFAQKAPYLFHGETDADADGTPIGGWDQGTRSFQCSRRADVLKLWVALQRHGADGIGALYDRLCATTSLLHERLAARRDFAVLHAPECNILCFRWIGDRALDDPSLDALNGALRERYNRSGAGWITTTVLDGRRVLRVTIMNPRTEAASIDALIDGLAATGRALVDETA